MTPVHGRFMNGRLHCRVRQPPRWWPCAAEEPVMRTFTIALTIAAATMATPGAARAQGGSYHFATAIPVGGDGGWDYLSIDPAAHRLYVSHATRVVVIDTQSNKVVGAIEDTPGVHGFAIAPGTRARLREQRPRAHGQHRRSEDAEDDSEGGHRREPRRDPLRAGPPRGLHDERTREVGDRLRRGDRQGRRHDSARRQTRVRAGRSRRPARSTSTWRT